jgi:riboflavin synthase
MFTGLIEEVGQVKQIAEKKDERRLTVAAPRISGELRKGDSVAVSGVCLTAVGVSAASFTADLAAETWTRTSFSRIAKGAFVNLELPLKADGRMGGHLVQGHVDGTGKFLGLKRISGGQDYWLLIEIPGELEKYVVSKGSIAVEGISLTVAKVEGNTVTIAVIPHTWESTNLKSLHPGDPVNLETDLVAKYVEKMLRREPTTPITLERLVAEGF